MSLQVIGAGVGRTGTFSLRLAIDRLGFGPCHHMEVVLHNMAEQVPLWVDAISDRADWSAIYRGYGSACDWPTACFYRELAAEYPAAKFILTERTPESWADSFAGTIRQLVAERSQAPAEMRDWLEMAHDVIVKTGFSDDLDRDGLMKVFVAHNAAVRAAIPADRLLVYQVRDGWGPLCEFLGAPVPDEPFPRTNKREEFWDLVRGGG